MTLPIPVVCMCGFSTMDAKKAVEHAEKHAKEKPDPRTRKELEDLNANKFGRLSGGKRWDYRLR